MAYIEQNIAISALTIRDQREVLRLVDESLQGSQGFFEELTILSAASELPNKAAGPVHEYNGPAYGLIGGCILPDPCVDLIAFDNKLDVDMKQGIEKQRLFDSGKTSFPIDNGVLRYIKGSACGIKSQSVGSGFDHLNYNAQRLFDTGKECVACLGKVTTAVSATVNCSLTIVDGFIRSVTFISRD